MEMRSRASALQITCRQYAPYSDRAAIGWFVSLGPLPAVLLPWGVMGFLGDGSYWRTALMFMPLTYLAGAIPALIAGLIFCKARQLIPWTGRPRNVVLHAGMAMSIGFLVGLTLGMLVFNADGWHLGLPGLDGGALAGAFLGAGRQRQPFNEHPTT